jgi:signal peptidase I
MPFVVAIILALLINKFLIFKILVPTASMFPTIKPNDRIMATRVHKVENLKRGEIVIFDSEELHETLVKRLIGLPGDKVEVKEDGAVYINDKKTDEPYVINKSDKPGVFKVPEDHYLFFGDNRSDSWDARSWKQPYISSKYIKGKAKFVIFPFNRVGMLK